MSDLYAYLIHFKPGPRSPERTWTRYASDLDSARSLALQALDEEYDGRAVLVSVEPLANPRAEPSER